MVKAGFKPRIFYCKLYTLMKIENASCSLIKGLV